MQRQTACRDADFSSVAINQQHRVMGKVVTAVLHTALMFTARTMNNWRLLRHQKPTTEAHLLVLASARSRPKWSWLPNSTMLKTTISNISQNQARVSTAVPCQLVWSCEGSTSGPTYRKSLPPATSQSSASQTGLQRIRQVVIYFARPLSRL